MREQLCLEERDSCQGDGLIKARWISTEVQLIR